MTNRSDDQEPMTVEDLKRLWQRPYGEFVDRKGLRHEDHRRIAWRVAWLHGSANAEEWGPKPRGDVAAP